jgi:hypothetical protein
METGLKEVRLPASASSRLAAGARLSIGEAISPRAHESQKVAIAS